MRIFPKFLVVALALATAAVAFAVVDFVDVDLALIAVGFTGVSTRPLYETLGVGLSARSLIDADERFRTSAPGVFACGDGRRGASLVVWAIWEGREAARAPLGVRGRPRHGK